ncbi:MAG TPA: universal stress protein [Rhodanobacteraceae bacterium]|jgi:nucleotide-binding universal stress UspA family protein|nr:universal stress protein [Rhodanobacteraceae bacterium]
MSHEEAATMFKHILVPTDGSKLSERALKQAVQLAKESKAKVTALHVIPKFHTFTYQAEMLEVTAKEYEASTTERARQYLRFAERAATTAGVSCDSAHAFNDQPYQEIIKTARNKKCDLILMASHGRRGIEGFLLGSETQKVLTHSKVPVLVYR